MTSDPGILCRLDDIADGDSAGFATEIAGRKRLVMVIRQGETVQVYLNSCPHIGAPLDFNAGRFLSHDKSHILCSTHGALFRIEDGFCVAGPCINAYLERVPVAVRNGAVIIDD